MSYDRHLRLRALEYAKDGHLLTQTAAVFKINISTIIAWKRRYEATGDVKVKIRRPVNKKIIPEKLIKYVEEHPDAYLKEIAEVFGCHPSSAMKRLRKLRLREKKSTFYKEQNPKQVEAYLEKIKDISKEKFVYIDETGLQTQMYRQYARSKRGKRVNIRISGKRHARIGLVAAQCESALLAPHTYSGTMKASVFEEELLKKLQKDHLIIMDNAAFHKKEVLYKIVKKYSQELIFLPPYSPEYNPIEHTWSALKRKVAGCVHLYGSVSQALDAVLKGN